jgi:predicted PurR-regulated permease PerM
MTSELCQGPLYMMLSQTQRYAVYFATLLVIAGVAWLLGPVLSPFVAAGIFAYICVPLVDRLSRRKLPRTAAVIVVMLLVALFLIGLILIMVPLIQEQVRAVLSQIPAFNQWVNEHVLPWLATHLNVQLRFDAAFFQERLKPLLERGGSWLGEIAPSLTSGGLALIGLIGSLALFPIVLFYFLRDWRSMLRTLEDLMPRRIRPEMLAIAQEVDEVLGQFLRGQLSVMASLALYYAVALWAVGLKSALPIGLLTGMLAFVPYLGFSLGVVLASAAAIVQFHGILSVLPVLGVYLVGQLLESYVLTPWLVGDRVGLHPVWVIFAILAFGNLLGFVGVLLAVPLAAITLVLVRHLKQRYQSSALYKE